MFASTSFDSRHVHAASPLPVSVGVHSSRSQWGLGSGRKSADGPVGGRSGECPAGRRPVNQSCTVPRVSSVTY